MNLTTGDNTVYIGSGGAATESQTLRIGEPGLQTQFILGGVYGIVPDIPGPIPVFIDSNGQVGTVPSSARFKENIRDMGDDSLALLRLRPVSFRYKGQQEKHYGLVAEEVDEVIPELVVTDSAGEPQAVLSHELPAMLLNELQRQHREVGALQDADRRLEERISAEQREAAEIERSLAALRRGISERETKRRTE